ncbi:8-amino-7-oxononanoate synthase [Riemerella anatipestifer]|nr:8-amino-7-oxononanoate synthase [Riemerella anatipestifer]MDY3325825.1 8-amino-7-oxononanoate synthase [Riemerella anatipestifer]MDY3354367.1 8-amino-7-oxononanoate synthase [Riemerella anatipestifer]
MNIPKRLLDKISERKEKNAWRVLTEYTGEYVDFFSNDYLGFSKEVLLEDDKVTSYPKALGGSTGSRLLSGNLPIFREAEEVIKDFHQSEAALIFNSGYNANLGVLSSLPQRNDWVLYDELSHASIRDGIRLSYAQSKKFKHNDLEDLEHLLKTKKETSVTGEIYIVTESVFSMDGDAPDIEALLNLAQRYGAYVIIDEAHALGVFGEYGSGLSQVWCQHSALLCRVVTFGKGLGCHGAAVLCSELLREYLVNFVRSFIYTTALDSHSVLSILKGYKALKIQTYQREKLLANIAFFKSEVERLGLSNYFIPSESPIQGMLVQGNSQAKLLSRTLEGNGYIAKAILSPTVPEGKERLRFCIHAYNTPSEITGALEIAHDFIISNVKK